MAKKRNEQDGPESLESKYTPARVASNWQVSAHKVLSLIKSGELKAINIAAPTLRRPRYLIPKSALLEFEKSRLVSHTPTPMQAKRIQRKRNRDLTNFV